jgi:hypothetical protein
LLVVVRLRSWFGLRLLLVLCLGNIDSISEALWYLDSHGFRANNSRIDWRRRLIVIVPLVHNVRKRTVQGRNLVRSHDLAVRRMG